MKNTLPLIIALGLSSLAFGQGHSNGSTIEDAVALKAIVTKVNTGVELTAEETEIYNKAKTSAANRRGPGGGGQGMQQGGGQGMQGGPQGMQGGPQGKQGGPSAEQIKQIFTEADKDGDGQLDDAEFKAACEAMRTKRG